MESLISDGRYTPGKMKQIRDKAAGKLFLQRPSVKQKVMKSPASYKWQQEGRLDFQDRIGDGFAARYSKELLVLDAEEDWRLRDFVEEVKVALLGVQDQYKAILLVSDMIQKTLGGLGSKVQDAFQKRIQDLKLPQGDSLYIGELMAGAQAGYMGSGMCRHRCLLFKYLAQRLKVCDCAAITGVIVPNDCQNVSKFRKENGFADHAWNIVRLEGRNYLLDVMNMPKQLQSLNSAEKVQMKVHGESYVYYRYDGGSGLTQVRESKGPKVPALFGSRIRQMPPAMRLSPAARVKTWRRIARRISWTQTASWNRTRSVKFSAVPLAEQNQLSSCIPWI